MTHENTLRMRRKSSGMQIVPRQRTRSVFLRYRVLLWRQTRVAYMGGRYAAVKRQLYVPNVRRQTPYRCPLGYDNCFSALHLPLSRRKHELVQKRTNQSRAVQAGSTSCVVLPSHIRGGLRQDMYREPRAY